MRAHCLLSVALKGLGRLPQLSRGFLKSRLSSDMGSRAGTEELEDVGYLTSAWVNGVSIIRTKETGGWPKGETTCEGRCASMDKRRAHVIRDHTHHLRAWRSNKYSDPVSSPSLSSDTRKAPDSRVRGLPATPRLIQLHMCPTRNWSSEPNAHMS